MFRYDLIPPAVAQGLIGYLENRWQPGGFVSAVLENNLREAIGRADEGSLSALPAIVAWLHNFAPSKAWGSTEAVKRWVCTDGETVRAYSQMEGYAKLPGECDVPAA